MIKNNNLDFNQAGNDIPSQFDVTDFKTRAKGSLKSIFGYMFPNGRIRGNEFVIGNLDGSPGDSCSFNLDKDGLGSEFNGGNSFSDFIDVWSYSQNVSFQDSVKEISERFGIPLQHTYVAPAEPVYKPEPKQEKVIEHKYLDRDNNLLCSVLRIEYDNGDKTFRPRLTTGEYKMPIVRPLYNIPKIVNEDTVVFVEGEKCVDALTSKNIPSASAMGGSNTSMEKTDWSVLEGKNLIIWPDNDEAGKKYATKLSHFLNNKCASIKVVDIPDQKPRGWDVADAIEENFDINEVLNTEGTAPINLLNNSLSVKNLVQGKAPAYEYLLESTLPKGVAGILAASGDTGKGILTLDLGMKIAYGNVGIDKAFDATLLDNGNVVILTAEDEKDEIHRRIEKLDKNGHRFRETGCDLHIIPFPDHGGVVPIVAIQNGRPVITDEWKQIERQIMQMDNLALVVIDPLASFILADINADPSHGAFVTGYFASLATRTNATFLMVHHMTKIDIKYPVRTPEHARNLIRGTSALVDGSRFAMALWPAPESEAKTVCVKVEETYKRNKVIYGAVVKSNGPVNREVRIFVRNDESGLLEGTSQDISVVDEEDKVVRLRSVIYVIREAARNGNPFTVTGEDGFVAREGELPPELKNVSQSTFRRYVSELIDDRKIVRARLKENTGQAKYLDVPDGPFAHGFGELKVGKVT